MPDVDTKLATALRQAKTQPMFFAFIAVGSSDGVLLVAKKKISVKEINEAKAESGGKKVNKGRCQGQDGQMVFEMAEEAPGNLAKALKKTIQESAGMTMQVETRVAPDLAEEGEGNESSSQEIPQAPTPPPQQQAPQQAAQQAPTPPPQQPTANDATARFTAKLKALAPILQKIEANNSPAAVNARQAVADGNAHFRAKDYDKAIDSLTTAEGLLKQALLAGTQAQPKADDSPEAKTFAQELVRMQQLVNACVKGNKGDVGKMRGLLMFAEEKGEAGQFAPGLQALKQLDALVQQAAAQQEPEQKSVIPYRKAQLRWAAAKSTARQAIQELITKATQEFPEQVETFKTINEIIDDLNLGLSDTLDAADSAGTEQERASLHAQAVGLIDDYIDLIDDSELIVDVDNNPWTKPNIGPTFTAALNEIANLIK